MLEIDYVIRTERDKMKFIIHAQYDLTEIKYQDLIKSSILFKLVYYPTLYSTIISLI